MGINTFNDRQKSKGIVVEGVISGRAELLKCSNLQYCHRLGFAMVR